MEEEYEEQKEDKYRDITTAGEDVDGFERFVEEKKGNNYNFETDYHWETPKDQRNLEKEFNDTKLKRAGEDLKPPEKIVIGSPQTCVAGEWKNGKCVKDKDKDDDPKKVIIKKTKKIYKDNDDNDVEDLAAYNMGYRNGKFDTINKMPFNDAFPFDDKDGQTWYKIGYRSGWDSGK